MEKTRCLDSFAARQKLPKSGHSFFSLAKVAEQYPSIKRWPVSMRTMLEMLLRNENGREVTRQDVENLLSYDPLKPAAIEMPFMPARVLLQDFTGVPCVVDLAAMRSAVARSGGDPSVINPLVPVNLVIDHSLQVDEFGSSSSARRNAEIEFARNRERYEFLRWGQSAFRNFSVVPPASGICHQVNLEHIATVTRTEVLDGQSTAFPDSCIGTDSHTTMINGLGVVGWGVGGIEAEANMLGQPMAMMAPAVVGVRLSGGLRPGVTATDAVLALTELLRKHGVVNKFVEFFGPGAASMSVPDRATLANMAPEYGATMGFFPVDERTLDYLQLSGRSRELIELTREYYQAQGLFAQPGDPEPLCETVLDVDLAAIEPAVAGPKRPQDRILLSAVKQTWRQALVAPVEKRGFGLSPEKAAATATATTPDGRELTLPSGAVIIASITSCTNTSNPDVLVAAALLAGKAKKLGIATKPWVKTSFAPGSLVVTDYLKKGGLLGQLESQGFHVVGYGCAVCIGNSGPVPAHIAQGVSGSDFVASAVLSGNRNFEGRVNPLTKANFLASPPLVVAYALAGTVDIDFDSEPIGTGKNGKPVYLKDIWPSKKEIDAAVAKAVSRKGFEKSYRNIAQSNPRWNRIPVKGGALYQWDKDSTYIQEPPFFAESDKTEAASLASLINARVLAMVGDSITTDHISPAGSISKTSPAGRYLASLGVAQSDFNSYGARRGNDRIMTRGTFANIRLRNLLAPGSEGSATLHQPSQEAMDIHSASERYKAEGVDTIVLAGKDYGMGSSRDWAAKGVFLLGVKAVIAESFERIHRSNLVGMGVLPLQFHDGENRESLGLTGRERFSISIPADLKPRQDLAVTAASDDGKTTTFMVRCRVDSSVEIDYMKNGGILQTVLKRLTGKA